MTALQKIESLGKKFATAAHGQVAGGGVDRYAAEYARGIDAAINSPGNTREILKTYPNGISKVRVTDAAGEIVAEYHDVI